ncbi:MAG TPA: D-aminoacyl-tRNA deacylase [Rectinemataceae bacterium]|nr:D-aminoacyl-tRNA deacylase [Rectinemataceae bacterium]
MRAVAQRVSSASVTIGRPDATVTTGAIDVGLLIYLGVGAGDADADAEYLADKVANLRIFMDDGEKMNLSLLDLGYGALVVSQFTLYADARKGRRPSYSDAAGNEEAARLYEYFCRSLASKGIHVETGRFREVMRVSYVNEGPVTILLDSRKLF